MSARRGGRPRVRADVAVVVGFFAVLGLLLLVSVAVRGHRHDRTERVALIPQPSSTTTDTASGDSASTVYTPRTTVAPTVPSTTTLPLAPAAAGLGAGGPVPPPAVDIASLDPACGPSITVTVSIVLDPRASILSVTLATADQTAAMLPAGGDLWRATVVVSATTEFVVTIRDSTGRVTTLTSTLAAC